MILHYFTSEYIDFYYAENNDTVTGKECFKFSIAFQYCYDMVTDSLLHTAVHTT